MPLERGKKESPWIVPGGDFFDLEEITHWSSLTPYLATSRAQSRADFPTPPELGERGARDLYTKFVAGKENEEDDGGDYGDINNNQVLNGTLEEAAARGRKCRGWMRARAVGNARWMMISGVNSVGKP